MLYVRVSALMGRGGEDFHSPDLQVEAMRRLVARNGLVEVEVVQDIDRTGRDFAREGLQQIMQLARDRHVDVVAVYDLSRFGRNTGESLRHIAELRELGVGVVSTVEQIDGSPEGQFMLGQFLGMAQLYSDQIGRRWQQVLEHRARQGRWHGSNPPVGYALEPGVGLRPHPVEAALVTEAFRRYADGHLVSHIARDITERRGRLLAHETLKRAFSNPVYRGRVVLNGVEHKGRHEQLVDQTVWERVQRRLAVDARTPSRRLAVSHSLVGLVLCAHCEHHLQLHRDARRPGEPGRLQCRQRLQGGIDVCPGPGTPLVSEVEQEVLRQLPELAARLRADPASRAAKQAERVRAGIDADQLRRQLRKNDATLANLAVSLARGDLSVTAYGLAAEQLERESSALRLRIEDAQQTSERLTSRATITAVDGILRLWQSMTVPERNLALKSVLVDVRVRGALRPREPVKDRVTVE